MSLGPCPTCDGDRSDRLRTRKRERAKTRKSEGTQRHEGHKGEARRKGTAAPFSLFSSPLWLTFVSFVSLCSIPSDFRVFALSRFRVLNLSVASRGNSPQEFPA